jgi:parallel beta-helix repeat protein
MDDRDGAVAPEPGRDALRGRTRREASLVLGASAAAALLGPTAAEASSSGIFTVVDAAGGGDFADLHQAVVSAPAGSTIFVKRGLYPVGAQLAPAAGVRIVGEGYGSHVRLNDAANVNLFDVATDNVIIQGLRVDGNGLKQKLGWCDCVRFAGATGGRVLDCVVESAAGYNIVAYPDCSEIVFAGNRSLNARQEGIELYGTSHSAIVGNVVIGAGVNGINVWEPRCGFNSVVGNTVRGSGRHGIVVSAGAHDITVGRNTCDGNASSGITVGDPAFEVSVTGNVVSGNGFGIQIYKARGCTVAGNVARGNNPYGLYLNGISGCTVRGNVVTGNGEHGIRLETDPGQPDLGSVVAGNVCAGNGRVQKLDGISVGGSVRAAIVRHNRCYDDGAVGSKTQRYGIAFDSAASPDNVLLGPNLLNGNGSLGLPVPVGTDRVHAVPFRRVQATVGTAQTAVQHGLPYTPRAVQVLMKSPGTVWRSAPSDANNVYLTADAPNRRAEVTVG